MHIIAQDSSFYRRLRVDLTDCPTAQTRLKILHRIAGLREAGNTVAVAVHSQGISRATYYRWRDKAERFGPKGLRPESTRPGSHPGRQWTLKDAERVLTIRRQRPYIGKLRLHGEHNARHPDRPLALATVGRIISWAIRRNRIRRCSFVERGREKRKRCFNGSHARRWRRSDRHKGVQFDHMTTWINGTCFKEFRAVCPVTRLQYARVYSSASARVARDFFQEAAGHLNIQAVQVDGGSEFMGEFEAACRERGTPLLVLPPHRPHLNGIVERANRTARIECWGVYRGEFTCRQMNKALEDYLNYYNKERPHRGLGMKTPQQANTIHQHRLKPNVS